MNYSYFRRKALRNFKLHNSILIGMALVFVGLADNWTWPKPCLKLMEGAREAGLPAEIAAYDGAYHAFDHPSLPLRTRIARNQRWKKKEREVTIGSNPAARDAAITRLKDWLSRHLGDS